MGSQSLVASEFVLIEFGYVSIAASCFHFHFYGGTSSLRERLERKLIVKRWLAKNKEKKLYSQCSTSGVQFYRYTQSSRLFSVFFFFLPCDFLILRFFYRASSCLSLFLFCFCFSGGQMVWPTNTHTIIHAHTHTHTRQIAGEVRWPLRISHQGCNEKTTKRKKETKTSACKMSLPVEIQSVVSVIEHMHTHTHTHILVHLYTSLNPFDPLTFFHCLLLAAVREQIKLRHFYYLLLFVQKKNKNIGDCTFHLMHLLAL